MIQGLIDAVKQANSAPQLVGAVRDLAAVEDPAALPMLVEVLGYNNPGAAVAAVAGLVALGDRAVPFLLENLDGYDYGARAWATRALAEIGDPRALDLLLAAAQGDFALSVRRAAAKGLGYLHWSKLGSAAVYPAQQRVFAALVAVTQDPEWVVRYAAIAGLQALATAITATASLKSQILGELAAIATREEERALRARAQWACEQLNLTA
ncbi:MAG: HEAT repeat domain-containing protein [Chloroflexaceae bacterium]|nr:HEAT repeat domain-containing protein [Chloroflexaceae bacterium]